MYSSSPDPSATTPRANRQRHGRTGAFFRTAANYIATVAPTAVLLSSAPGLGGCAAFLEDPFLVQPQRGNGSATTTTGTSSPESGAESQDTLPGSPSPGTAAGGGTASTPATPIDEDTVNFSEPDAGAIAGAGSAISEGGAGGESSSGAGGTPSGAEGGSGGESMSPNDPCAGPMQQQGDCTEVSLSLEIVNDSGTWGEQADIDALVDGSTNQAVWATATEAWVEIELSEPAVLSRVSVAAGNSDGMSWQLLYFDGSDFVVATDDVTATSSSSTEATVDGVTADRVRVVFTTTSEGSGTFGGGNFQGGGGYGGGIVVQEIELFGVVAN